MADNLARVPTRGEGSLSYLRMIALHIAGNDPTTIADALGCSPDTVKNALASREGIALLNQAKQRIRENAFGKIEAELIDLATISVDNLRETVEARFTPGSKGKVHQDNVGLKLLGVLGYESGAMAEGKKATLSMDNELGKRLLTALEKSEEAERLHGQDVTDLSPQTEESGTDNGSN